MGDAKSNLDVAPGSGDALAPLRLIALVLVQEGHVALSLGRGEHWRVDAGYTFIPLALPGGALGDGARSDRADDAAAALDARIERIGRAHLGQPARVRRGRWCYGASDAHAVDRRAVSAEDAPGPLLEVRRALPLDDDHAPGIADVARPPLRSVVVRAYRVALAGPAMPGPETAGLVWLTPEALRRTIGGLPLADWRKLRGARCDIAKDATLPDDAFVYVPGDYGERYLLRAVAKYGVEAVLPPDDAERYDPARRPSMAGPWVYGGHARVPVKARKEEPPMDPMPVRAPELRGTAWLNTERPLTLPDLRGKLVLLDFWTYCCINCLHVLEDLKYLEHKYAGRPLVVVGVHSPKFTNEDNAGNVRQAIARYGITHPVLLDSGRRTWDAYAVRGWPTLVLIDPRGYLLGQVSGEGHREQLDAAIGQALELLAADGVLDDRPLPLRLEAEAGALSPTSPLLYPGKVLADERSGALFIADTGHHRLVRARLDADDRQGGDSGGEGYTLIGSGEPGAQDGDFDSASFHAPQGMALDGERGWLYVADTGSHLIRRVDLAARTVTTVAGTGEQGHQRRGAWPARAAALNSPWDLCLFGGKLYIAMAGSHQLWVYDPADETIAVFAGSGAEGRADGPASMAALAQPSGLATDGARLYVADSEISCVRMVSVGADGDGARVTTLAGGDLFQFGDRDGRGDAARLQHPLDVAWVQEDAPGGGQVYVADTYNHKLRQVDPTTRQLTTFAGGGVSGERDGPAIAARFAEPSGLSYARGRLYVADTNNHAIRVVALAEGAVSTLTIPGLCAPGICLPG